MSFNRMEQLFVCGSVVFAIASLLIIRNIGSTDTILAYTPFARQPREDNDDGMPAQPPALVRQNGFYPAAPARLREPEPERDDNNVGRRRTAF